MATALLLIPSRCSLPLPLAYRGLLHTKTRLRTTIISRPLFCCSTCLGWRGNRSLKRARLLAHVSPHFLPFRSDLYCTVLLCSALLSSHLVCLTPHIFTIHTRSSVVSVYARLGPPFSVKLYPSRPSHLTPEVQAHEKRVYFFLSVPRFLPSITNLISAHPLPSILHPPSFCRPLGPLRRCFHHLTSIISSNSFSPLRKLLCIHRNPEPTRIRK